MLYRPDGQFNGTLFKTGNHYIEVPAPVKGQYIVEVRVHSEGGDGEVALVKIPGMSMKKMKLSMKDVISFYSLNMLMFS